MAQNHVTRYFIHFAAPTPEDAHDKVESHGRAVEVKMYADPHGGWIYRSAEVELHDERKGD